MENVFLQVLNQRSLKSHYSNAIKHTAWQFSTSVYYQGLTDSKREEGMQLSIMLVYLAHSSIKIYQFTISIDTYFLLLLDFNLCEFC